MPQTDEETGVPVEIVEDETDKALGSAEEELKALLDSKNLQISFDISFPRYAIIPDEVSLALKVLKKNEMKISFILTPKTPLDKP